MQDANIHSNARVILESIYEKKDEKVGRKKNKNHDAHILFFLIIFGISGLAFGFWRMGGIIKRPLQMLQAPRADALYAAVGTNGVINASAAELSVKDTDGDGLNDYDELYIYKTSPYLEDSDSDGVSDSAEIQKGTNPNCLGANCDASAQPSPALSQENNTQIETPQGEITPAYLRSLLGQSGVPSEYIQKLSDQEILDLYYSTIKENSPSVPSASNTNTNTGQAAAQAQDIQKMSPQELRDFLKKSGMSDEMLGKFSDEEILQAVQDTIKEQK